MAHAIGAAPRYFGKSEAWTLMPPCGGTASTSRERIWPYAATTSKSGCNDCNAATPSGVLMLSGWRTATPCSWAMVFMPRPVCRVEPRSAPAARSGCVTRPTTECGLAKSASKVGSANSPVPIITRRINMPSLAGAAGWRRNCGLQNVGWRRRPVLFHRLRSFFQDAFQLLRRGYLAFLLFTLEVVLEFLELVPAGQAADGAHLVNEQNAVEMIDFVLPQPCFQIADAFVDDFATQVVRLHADGLGPANLLEQ